MTVDYAYEEQVRHVYRTPNVQASAPVEAPSVLRETYQSPQPKTVPQPIHSSSPAHSAT
jgi:stress response protein YsnF